MHQSRLTLGEPFPISRWRAPLSYAVPLGLLAPGATIPRWNETYRLMQSDTAPADDMLHAFPDASPDDVPADEPVAAAPVDAGPSEGTVAEDANDALPSDVEPPEPAPPEDGFGDLGLSPEIVQAVTEKGYRIPTPIQAQAIPTILMGRDVLGCAQTGTGKTGSFVLPMLDILSGSRARARMPRSLILEPTRELALQVAENFVQYGKHLKLNHALLIGGESLSDQKEVLMRGVDVLIATPGRLMDLFDRGGLLLTDVSMLVIDEADRMLDMGFIPDVEKIVGFLPRTRQTLFFSATMAPEIRRLADAFLQNPKEITVSRPASVATTIVAGLTVVDELDKREALRRLLRAEAVSNALIFCNRKRDVDILYKSLRKHGFSVGELHGDMSQPERFATLAKFKANELHLLVCSDVAARGIDIGGLSHVFNFDVPIHPEDYVHRIGRTGRAGQEGHAFTLATPDDRLFVEAIEKLVGAPIPRLPVDGMALLEFSEDAGKKRRGRGGRPTARTPVRAKEPTEELAKPRRTRARKAEPAVVDAPSPDAMPADAEPMPSRKREARRDGRSRPRDDEARPRDDEARPREEEPRARTREDDRSRRVREEEPRRAREDEPRRFRHDEPRRFRRDDDLGPSVLGFGDDVPAFMLLRARHGAEAG